MSIFTRAPKNPHLCNGCNKEKPDVEERHSYGITAGRLCIECCSTYEDNCGLDGKQGKVEELDEFMLGGYDAIYGEDELS